MLFLVGLSVLVVSVFGVGMVVGSRHAANVAAAVAKVQADAAAVKADVKVVEKK